MIFENEISKNNLQYTDDLKIPNAGSFKILNEDHTLGNLLKDEILTDVSQVIFAGYKKPHPLEKHVILKIQTIEGKHPIDVFRQNVIGLIDKSNSLRNKFQEEMKKRYIFIN